MTEDEIMARAIHATRERLRVKGYCDASIAAVNGKYADVQAAAIALRNLTIPLSEILPEDPDEREAWAIFIDRTDWSGPMLFDQRAVFDGYKRALAAIKRGRKLAGEGK
jgi:hypothetical protein